MKNGKKFVQNVFRSTALAPSSSYSRFDTHIFLNVSNDARIEPLGKKHGNKIVLMWSQKNTFFFSDQNHSNLIFNHYIEDF